MRGRSVSMAAFAVLACVAVPAGSAEAQLAGLIPGVRARIRAPGSINGRLTGTVIARSADSLSIAMENGAPLRLPLSAITAVDISRGKSRSRGAMKGALWGGGFGLLSGLFSDSGGDKCSGDCASRGEVMAAGVLGLGLTGAVIGAFVQSESWEKQDVPVRTALRWTPGRTTAVVSVRF